MRDNVPSTRYFPFVMYCVYGESGLSLLIVYRLYDKKFWYFVGTRTKYKNKTISSLKSEAGISVSNTKGKLQIFQQLYQLLGTSVVDSAFDEKWKLEVEENVLEYSKQNFKDLYLYNKIEESEIVT